MQKQSEPEVIYEDHDLIGVSKPAGMLVHAARANGKKEKSAIGTLVDWLLKKYPEIRGVGESPDRPGIVHRLDKDTSGVMVVALTQKGFEYLKRLFMDRAMTKKYLALVRGRVREKSGVVDAPIGLRPGTTKRTVRGGKMIKLAETRYVLKKYIGSYSLLEVEPKTGRTHQIRVHLHAIGHPVAGDPLYGGGNAAPRLMLHAESIEFTLPSGERLLLSAEPPEDFMEVLRHLGEEG